MRALDDYLRGGWQSGPRELTGAGFGRSRRFSPGEPVLTHGVPGQHAALITSGLVKVTLPSADRLNGNAGTLLSIRGPGELVGEETAILGADAPAIAVGHDADRFMVTASPTATPACSPPSSCAASLSSTLPSCGQWLRDCANG